MILMFLNKLDDGLPDMSAVNASLCFGSSVFIQGSGTVSLFD